MGNYIKDIALLTAVVYSLVESFEKFGLKRKYAHILAIPIGILTGFLGFPLEMIANRIFYGLIIGILSVGTCDTACNIVSIIRKETDNTKK